MLLFFFIASVLSLSFYLVFLWLWLRRHRYLRYLEYNPAQDCYLGMSDPATQMVPLDCSENGFVLRPIKPKAVSALLELDVQTTTRGAYIDPALELEAGDWRETCTVERGARGKRLFNVTRLIAHAKSSELSVKLNGHGLNWSKDGARLHLFRDEFNPKEKVLVISPHPDDAEIAAFGLYADSNATIVTLTAGDLSDRYTSPTPRLNGLSRAQVARMRVRESISVPQLGEVTPENALNLCFPDGRLSEMRKRPSDDFAGEGEGALDFAGLRRLNRSTLMREKETGAPPPCSWSTLVSDLRHILESIRPAVIVAPHPTLDPHEDHRAATGAIIEALRAAAITTGRFFFYCVHNYKSELWPFGPAGTGTTHLPILKEDLVNASGLYSHQLTIERQTAKFVALESMHDTRDMAWPVEESLGTTAVVVKGVLRWLTDGLDRTPTSYLRRAVRRDEPFFVVKFDDALKLFSSPPSMKAKAS